VLLALAWNFAVLASIQLTIRLIRAFSLLDTLLAAAALTPPFLAIALLYAGWLSARLAWFPLTMLAMGLCGYLVAGWLLRVRRLRGRIATAIGTAVLASPWPVFMLVQAG